MCGILGIYKAEGRIDADALLGMRRMLAHRGPDANGLYVSPDGRCSLAHTRLSIIDLSAAGNQPMSNSGGSVWVSYNGEIYNFQTIREELRGRGHVFRSATDTEVIAQGYEEWGIEGIVPRLRGMFAFALYDERTGRLFLARDRLGIKPLYYYHDGDLFLFSSEVRAMEKSGFIPVSRNSRAYAAFLLLGSVPEPLTTLNGVYALPSGSYMEFHGGRREIRRYFDLSASFAAKSGEIGSLRSVLTETVDIHLISDAPLGIFLSGGIDSTALVALATGAKKSPVTTLSIDFEEEEYSEREYQSMVASRFGTKHRSVRVTEGDFIEELERIFDAMDQPTVDGVNTYFVSKAAKEAGLKVVLSGLGGDEVFCGYSFFRRAGLLRRIFGLPPALKSPLAVSSWFGGRWRRLDYLRGKDPFRSYLVLRGFFMPDDVASILDMEEGEVESVVDSLSAGFEGSPALNGAPAGPVDWLSFMEMSRYLKNQLLKDTDFMSMRHSVETRVPYLDHVLVECVASAPEALKVERGVPKPLLVKPLLDVLPREVVYRKKQGFTFPFDLWVKRGARGHFEDAVAEGRINRRFAKKFKGKYDGAHWSKIWGLIVLGRTSR